MENAAMVAYLKDLENNTRDMTADTIIKEKISQMERKDAKYPNRSSTAAPGSLPRFKAGKMQFPQEIDPCDPTLSRTVVSTQHNTRPQQKGENKAQTGRNKQGKGKAKGKKVSDEDPRTKPVRKLWYEALSPDGYTYYWHVESNESVWEPPQEGYMTFAEQEEEAKEQALQEQLLKQLEEEEMVANAEILEEKRANAERERLKELRRTSSTKRLTGNNKHDGGKMKMEKEKKEGEEEEEEENDDVVVHTEGSRPYRRDYTIPVKSHPYGPWQTVQRLEEKPVDLQLPRQSKQLQLPVLEKTDPANHTQRTFKERTVTRIDAGDSDQDSHGPAAAFKKRKITNKNVRKRLTDD